MCIIHTIEVIKALQSAPSPDKPVQTSKEQKATISDKDARKDSHKDAPPKMTLPDHPSCMTTGYVYNRLTISSR